MEEKRIPFLMLLGFAWLSLGAGGGQCVRMTVDHVDVTLSEDGNGMRVSAVFPTDNASVMDASFALGDYGSAFILPHTDATPLEIGFDLQSKILSDPAFSSGSVKEKLPNKMPMPNLQPMVELKDAAENANVALYSYIDGEKQNWLGATGVFKVAFNKDFPPGLVVTQYYALDAKSQPRIVVVVNGPSAKVSGSVSVTEGSMSIFANVQALIDSKEFEPGKSVKLTRAKEFYSAPALLTPTPTPTPTSSPAYTVTRGQRVDKGLSVPASLSFDVTGMTPTDDMIEAHLIWAIEEGKDWNGGNPQPTSIYSASAKDYKLKCGAFGEHRINVNWDPSVKYTVKLMIESDLTTWTVWQGSSKIAETSVDATAPDRVTVSYGWPPTKRNGKEGVKLTNIKWSE